MTKPDLEEKDEVSSLPIPSQAASQVDHFDYEPKFSVIEPVYKEIPTPIHYPYHSIPKQQQQQSTVDPLSVTGGVNERTPKRNSLYAITPINENEAMMQTPPPPRRRNEAEATTIDEYTVTKERAIDVDSGSMRHGSGEESTRLIQIRSNSNELYGFDLETYADGRHVAKNIAKDSPAQFAGLDDGDMILDINGGSIEGLTKRQVIDRVRMFPRQVDLLVMSYKQVRRVSASGPAVNRLRKNSAFSPIDKRDRSGTVIQNGL